MPNDYRFGALSRALLNDWDEEPAHQLKYAPKVFESFVFEETEPSE